MKEIQGKIFWRTVGYSILTVWNYLLALLLLGLGLLAGFVVLGPKEQYIFPFIIGALALSAVISKTIALNVYGCKKVEDPELLALYSQVCDRSKILWLIPVKGIFKPILYHAEMKCPNAFACGFNFLFLARLPLIGSAVVVSDELVALIGNNKTHLAAILAHEIGHIISLDMFLASALSVSHSTVKIIAKWRKFSFGLIFLRFCMLPWLVVTHLFMSVISQLREDCADLHSVSVMNDFSIVEALSRVAEHSKYPEKDEAFGSLFLSHPTIPERADRIKSLSPLSNKN